MAVPMELDWSLTFGDQLLPFDDLTTFGLPGRFDGCENGLFNNDIADHCQDVLTPATVTWPNDYDYDYNCGYGLTPSPLASSPEQQHELFVTFPDMSVKNEQIAMASFTEPTPASPIQELPASPEDYFGSPDISEADRKFDDECMLFELDDMDSDVIVDQEKLASIGPSFPSVSVDDVLSLLSPDVLDSAAAVPSPTPVNGPSLTLETAVVTPLYFLPLASPDVVSQLGYISSPNSPGHLMAPSPMSTISQESSSSIISHVGYMSLPNSPGNSMESSPASSVCGESSNTTKPPTERRQRKKEQNKTAAQRYREKKRGEQGTVLSEYELLEKRNTELRAKVDDMTKEIAYLKGLIEEICA